MANSATVMVVLIKIFFATSLVNSTPPDLIVIRKVEIVNAGKVANIPPHLAPANLLIKTIRLIIPPLKVAFTQRGLLAIFLGISSDAICIFFTTHQMHKVIKVNPTMEEVKILLTGILEAKIANPNHTNKEPKKPNQKPRFESSKYVMKKKQYKPALRGTIILAVTAASTPWVIPIKRRETTAVEGKPISNPPSFPLILSAIVVKTATQTVPTTRESSHLITNVSI